MTGVLVMPIDGEMSPQGAAEEGSGVARWLDHTTAPLPASSLYTVSFSVATYT